MTIETVAVGRCVTNCYIVYDEKRDDALLIDPGDDEGAIKRALNGRTVAAVLLTHGHFDHIGVADAFDAPIYLHAADKKMIGDITLNGGDVFGEPRAYLFPTLDIVEGDALGAAGLSALVWHTPGHTPGGVCYEIGDCLFTGDTLFHRGYGRTDFALGDFHALRQSLKRLLKYPRDLRVYPGHGEQTTLRAEGGVR